MSTRSYLRLDGRPAKERSTPASERPPPGARHLRASTLDAGCFRRPQRGVAGVRSTLVRESVARGPPSDLWGVRWSMDGGRRRGVAEQVAPADGQLHERSGRDSAGRASAGRCAARERPACVPRALARGWRCRWMKVMEPRTKPRPARSRSAVVLAVALGWIVVMLALAQLLATSQAHARRDVAQRLAARTQAGAEFSSLYVKDLLPRERE